MRLNSEWHPTLANWEPCLGKQEPGINCKPYWLGLKRFENAAPLPSPKRAVARIHPMFETTVFAFFRRIYREWPALALSAFSTQAKNMPSIPLAYQALKKLLDPYFR